MQVFNMAVAEVQMLRPSSTDAFAGSWIRSREAGTQTCIIWDASIAGRGLTHGTTMMDAKMSSFMSQRPQD